MSKWKGSILAGSIGAIILGTGIAFISINQSHNQNMKTIDACFENFAQSQKTLTFEYNEDGLLTCE
ncbi:MULTISPECIES: hypothetical protein [Solibacillus]|uniref:Uncharacterized protein n=1 Tax=Solibacillus merdavium TaxID=2762218 RepID=A0ABR8XLE2_9BACL|nr:hypothetical protein [Solibacillus merdavium]MBD8032726.1 hypothetical protein [Solibacillus merdavium]